MTVPVQPHKPLKQWQGYRQGPLAFRTSSDRKADRTLCNLLVISGMEWPQGGILDDVAPRSSNRELAAKALTIKMALSLSSKARDSPGRNSGGREERQ